MISTALRYFHTLRHLRPGQVFGRLWFQAYTPTIDGRPAPALRVQRGLWLPSPTRKASMVGANDFRFLNQVGRVTTPDDWNAKTHPKLWLYNLHYFDDLNAAGAVRRRQWHRTLLQRWVDENPPGTGNGWESYPTSLRIVNWVKWALTGNALDAEWIHSLAVQARWMTRRLETHLLGNHLFANVKALVFAGLFFEGREADGWLDKGLALLHRELAGQILNDGGHFERSPMYHAIILEDLLDLINLAGVFPAPPGRERVQVWRGVAGKMLEWLRLMCHPDARIAFFNDAAFGVASEFDALREYGERLGVNPEPADAIRSLSLPGGGTLINLDSSGYVRVALAGSVTILDLAEIGPDYLPGHAHADTLSFESSFGNQRIIVNSGCSTYGSSSERARQRGTPAHNTVAIEGRDSSEVWDGFRVGRRARPFDKKIRVTEDGAEISCAHDGYRRLREKPIHRRVWNFRPKGITIRDRIDGTFTSAMVYYHFHPAVEMDLVGKTGKVRLHDTEIVRINVKKGSPVLVESRYHPEFGLDIPNQSLQIRFQGPESEIELLWEAGCTSCS